MSTIEQERQDDRQTCERKPSPGPARGDLAVLGTAAAMLFTCGAGGIVLGVLGVGAVAGVTSFGVVKTALGGALLATVIVFGKRIQRSSS